MKKMRPFLVWLIFGLTAALLIGHVFEIWEMRVDGVAVSLLGLLLIIPFVDLIRKIRIGDIEAVIEPREVEEAVEDANRELESTMPTDTEEIQDSQYIEILDLVEERPALGLAQLRIQIEKGLRRLMSLQVGAERLRIPSSIRQMLAQLSEQGTVPDSLVAAIEDVLPLANRAVHGEHVRREDALRIADIGVRILQHLRRLYADQLIEVKERRPISFEEVESFRNAQYEVRSVVPVVENPRLHVREMSQEGLHELLKGYDGYAEFLVELKRIA